MTEDIRKIVQSLLDKQLLQYGILSFFMRKEETDSIKGSSLKVSDAEYVVYRIVSASNRAYGDGESIIEQYRIDINYYYFGGKTKEKNRKTADARIKEIQAAILSDTHFRLYVGQNDIYDIDNPYRGINLQFYYFGATQS